MKLARKSGWMRESKSLGAKRNTHMLKELISIQNNRRKKVKKKMIEKQKRKKRLKNQ